MVIPLRHTQQQKLNITTPAGEDKCLTSKDKARHSAAPFLILYCFCFGVFFAYFSYLHRGILKLAFKTQLLNLWRGKKSTKKDQRDGDCESRALLL